MGCERAPDPEGMVSAKQRAGGLHCPGFTGDPPTLVVMVAAK
jgi:hypothetical protein